MNITVLVLAGGSGQRFWPLSTPEKPKQLLSLFSDQSMIRETINRVLPLVPPDKIFIATNIMQYKAIQKELPFIPVDNIIIEPAFKDTAAAIGYGSLYINQSYPDSEVIVLASDHLIKDEINFRNVLKIAVNEAHENRTIVTLGIKPSKTEIGYGYIETEPNTKLEEVSQVKRFCEKPNYDLARYYVESGNYFWNSGMFVFSIKTIFEEFKAYLPKHYSNLMKLKTIIETGLWGEELSKEVAFNFEVFEKVSIDYGIMEHSNRIKVIPSDFGWNDIGSFTALEDVFEPNENGTVFKTATINELNSKNNIIIGANTYIATIGIEGVVIIQTENTLLICKKDQLHDIKKLLSS